MFSCTFIIHCRTLFHIPPFSYIFSLPASLSLVLLSPAALQRFSIARSCIQSAPATAADPAPLPGRRVVVIMTTTYRCGLIDFSTGNFADYVSAKGHWSGHWSTENTCSQVWLVTWLKPRSHRHRLHINWTEPNSSSEHVYSIPFWTCIF